MNEAKIQTRDTSKISICMYVELPEGDRYATNLQEIPQMAKPSKFANTKTPWL